MVEKRKSSTKTDVQTEGKKRKFNEGKVASKKKSETPTKDGKTFNLSKKSPKTLSKPGSKQGLKVKFKAKQSTSKIVPNKSSEGKSKTFKDKQSGTKVLEEKPEDWNKFKKEKKELKLKRKQVKSNFDVVVQAKKIGEILRRKQLKEGVFERNKLVNNLHTMLKKDGNYPKFVLAHDTARIVQWLLKYSSAFIRQEIFKELSGFIITMMQSKYGVFCVKRLLKYGTTETRSQIIKSFYGNAVKLASHAVSAPYLEFAYSTWATPKQKLHLIQEFYGDMYKNSKDDNVKCLKDVFEASPDIKMAALSATKGNLSRILNKDLLDSGLVQTVLYQYLLECSADDKAELISQLVSHIVVISNSKDGSRAAMQCIWHGTNKDKKVLMKSLKEHLVELCKHEFGHCTIITLLDATDDTVLLNKIIISEILKNAKDLSLNEWGRKVLLWLIVPDDSSYFHPQFIKELKAGRENSTSKKAVETRRKELSNFASSTLLNLVTMEPEFWLSNSKIAYEMLAIVKSATGKEVEYTLESLVKVITSPDWKIGENESLGIEDAGMHLVLKKIAQHDKINTKENLPTFGAALLKQLTQDVIESWISSNRGCFLLVLVYENNCEEIQKELKGKIVSFKDKLADSKCQGAGILLKKIS